MLDSINYHKLDPSKTNEEFEYLLGGNLLSYVIAERTCMTPSEFFELKVSPLLGITDADFDWQHNLDGMSYSWHGIFTTVPVLAKLGMLYRQHGRASTDDVIVEESFVLDSTQGTIPNDEYGYGLHLVRENAVDPVYPDRATRYFAGGFGDNSVYVIEDLDRVYALISNNYVPPLAGGVLDDSAIQLGIMLSDPDCSFSTE